MTIPLFPSEPGESLQHTCHARGCERPVKPELLMCFAHWRMVPRVIQRAIWATYRPGQCDDKHPSREWFRAADAAIGFVARVEGKPINQTESTELTSFGFHSGEKVEEPRAFYLSKPKQMERR
jgi:hypothetical protein